MALSLYHGSDAYPVERYLSYNRYPEDQYEQHVIDPHYARHMQFTRYMRPPLEFRCCEKCVGRLMNAVQSLPGVEGVLVDRYDEVLRITGSADPEVIYQAVKYARKSNPGHYHYLPRKLHLLDRNPTIYDTQYYANRSYASPVEYRSSYYGTSYNPRYVYEDDASWRYGDTYGPSFGYMPYSSSGVSYYQ